MKKVLSLSIMALALIAFASSSAVACGSSCDDKKTDAKNTSAEKSSCSAKTDATKASADGKTCSSKTNAIKASADGKTCSSKTNAMKASASGTCSPEEMEACAKKMGVSVEELKNMCSEKGSMSMQTISIEGMTCGSCENTVTTALEAVPGVNRVVNISHKDGNALVCVDKKSTDLTSLTKAISDKGFKAEIIPAVANTSTVSADGKKSCSAAEKAACSSKDAPKKAEDTK